MPEAVNIFTGADPLLSYLSLRTPMFCPENWQKDPRTQRNCILMLFRSFVLQYMDSEQYAMTGIYTDWVGPWSMKKFFQVENGYFLLFGEVNYEVLKVWLNARNGTSHFFNLLLTKHLFLRALQNLAFCSPDATIQISLITFTILFFLPYHDSPHLST